MAEIPVAQGAPNPEPGIACCRNCGLTKCRESITKNNGKGVCSHPVYGGKPWKYGFCDEPQICWAECEGCWRPMAATPRPVNSFSGGGPE